MSPILNQDDIDKRIIAITGHYGSGKTEIAVSLALRFAANNKRPYKKISLVDLDIVNPYFRSRERRELLNNAGIEVYGSMYNTEITAELPALGANVRIPLEDPDCMAIVDFGGNDVGAMVINQFGKYFTPDNTSMLAVINMNRPDTSTIDGAMDHLAAIELVTGKKITGLINNSHMLRETTPDLIINGHMFCQQLATKCNIPIWADCFPAELISEKELQGIVGSPLLPLGLYMRPSWLDK